MNDCRHPLRDRVKGGYGGWTIKRYPLRYGSAEVDICERCGAWTMPVHSPGKWNAGPYGVARAQAIKECEEL